MGARTLRQARVWCSWVPVALPDGGTARGFGLQRGAGAGTRTAALCVLCLAACRAYRPRTWQTLPLRARGGAAALPCACLHRRQSASCPHGGRPACVLAGLRITSCPSRQSHQSWQRRRQTHCCRRPMGRQRSRTGPGQTRTTSCCRRPSLRLGDGEGICELSVVGSGWEASAGTAVNKVAKLLGKPLARRKLLDGVPQQAASGLRRRLAPAAVVVRRVTGPRRSSPPYGLPPQPGQGRRRGRVRGVSSHLEAPRALHPPCKFVAGWLSRTWQPDAPVCVGPTAAVRAPRQAPLPARGHTHQGCPNHHPSRGYPSRRPSRPSRRSQGRWPSW